MDSAFPEDASEGVAVLSVRAGVDLWRRLRFEALLDNVLDARYHEHLTREAVLPTGGLAAGDEVPTGRPGQLRDSDAFVGIDRATVRAQVTRGSTTVRAATSGAFASRGIRDVVEGVGLAADTIVVSRPSTDSFVLSHPWTGATGAADLVFHADQHNYCVHFEASVP